jgi:type 1 glutamine amidotransferase
VVSEVWLLEGAEPLSAKIVENAVMAKAAVQKPLPASADQGPLVPAPDDKDATNVLIVTGNDYPGHKWKLTAPVLSKGIAEDKRLEVKIAWKGEALCSDRIKDYDTIVLHWMNWKCPDPGPRARKNLVEFVSSGGGLVLVHFACGAFQGWDEFGKIAGRAWNPKLRGHDPRGPFTVNITDVKHPITKGMKDFKTDDELYTCLDGRTPITVLATSVSKKDKKVYPMAFVLKYGKGRVFHCVLGHDVKAFSFPGVLELFRRGTAWTAGIEAVKN